MDLINNNINRDVQEECANRLYRVYIHSSNTDDVNSLQFIKLSQFRSLMAWGKKLLLSLSVFKGGSISIYGLCDLKKKSLLF